MRKRCRRRLYRVDPGAWAHTIELQHPMVPDQLDGLGLAVHNAIQRMRLGLGDEQAWSDLAVATNISLILCERGWGSEHEADIITAQEALMRAQLRARDTGRWAFDGPGMQAVNHAIAVHELQLAVAPRVDCVAAMAECRRRMERGNVMTAERSTPDSAARAAG